MPYIRLHILTHLSPPLPRPRTPLTRVLGLTNTDVPFLTLHLTAVCDVILGLESLSDIPGHFCRPVRTRIALVSSLVAILPPQQHTSPQRPHPYRRPLAKSLSTSPSLLPSTQSYSRPAPPMSNSRTRSRSNSGSDASTASPRVRLRRSRSRDRSPSAYSTRGEPFYQQQTGTEPRSEYASASASGSRSPQPGHQSRPQQDSSSTTWTSAVPDSNMSTQAYPAPRKQNVACDACRSRKVKCVRNPGMDKASCFAAIILCSTLGLPISTPQTRVPSVPTRGVSSLVAVTPLLHLLYGLHLLWRNSPFCLEPS